MWNGLLSPQAYKLQIIIYTPSSVSYLLQLFQLHPHPKNTVIFVRLFAQTGSHSHFTHISPPLTVPLADTSPSCILCAILLQRINVTGCSNLLKEETTNCTHFLRRARPFNVLWCIAPRGNRVAKSGCEPGCEPTTFASAPQPSLPVLANLGNLHISASWLVRAYEISDRVTSMRWLELLTPRVRKWSLSPRFSKKLKRRAWTTNVW